MRRPHWSIQTGFFARCQGSRTKSPKLIGGATGGGPVFNRPPISVTTAALVLKPNRVWLPLVVKVDNAPQRPVYRRFPLPCLEGLVAQAEAE
ncbi:hypothetical protein SRHO_G00236720 [Serrasalmus rhombeus]